MDIELSAQRHGKQNEADRLMGKAIREACKPGMKPFTVVIAQPGGRYYRFIVRPWKPKSQYKIETRSL